MKILTNKKYNELIEYKDKYQRLSGELFTIYTGCRSRRATLLSMSKEEIVKHYFDLNKAYIELYKKYLEGNNEN